MNESILITGVTGYIGKTLSDTLLRDMEYKIIPVSRQNGYDISCPGWTKKIPQDKVNIIIHLAQSRRYRDFPRETMDIFQVNVAATLELAEWARQHGVRRFIFTSTGNVYKPTLVMKKYSEEDICFTPSIYAATKLSAEHLLQPYSDFFEVVVMRLFGVYGPQQNQMLIADMIRRIKLGEQISLAGGVGIYITPLFIDDCVNILKCLSKVPITNPYLTLNVAGNEVLSLAEIIDVIGKQVNKKPVIEITSTPPKYFCGDNTNLKAYYSDFIPFSSGINMTLEKEKKRKIL